MATIEPQTGYRRARSGTVLPTPTSASPDSPPLPQPAALALAEARPGRPASDPAASPWPLDAGPRLIISAYGRLLFLVNLLLGDALYPDFTRPAERGFPVPLWRLLGWIGADLIGPAFAADPLSALLDQLAGEAAPIPSVDFARQWPIPDEESQRFRPAGRRRPSLRRLPVHLSALLAGALPAFAAPAPGGGTGPSTIRPGGRPVPGSAAGATLAFGSRTGRRSLARRPSGRMAAGRPRPRPRLSAECGSQPAFRFRLKESHALRSLSTPCPQMKRDDRPSVSELRDAGVAEAFRPLLLAAAWRVAVSARERLGEAAVDENFPFLNEYAAAFEAVDDVSPEHPLLTLAALADWPASASEIWLVMGLIDEDARFGAVFQALDPEAGERRPSLALLQSWWGTQPREGLRPALRALLDLGLLHACAAGAGRHDAAYEVEENCWAAARGEALREPWPGTRLQAPEAAPALADLLLPGALRGEIERLAPLLDRHGGSLIVGGPEHNGRGSVLAALARRAGRQALFIDWPAPNGGDAPRWLGAFATLAGARAIVRLRATPGERLRLPRLAGYGDWIGVACGDEETLEAPPLPAFRLRLPLPDAALREALLAAHGAGSENENGETGGETGATLAGEAGPPGGAPSAGRTVASVGRPPVPRARPGDRRRRAGGGAGRPLA
jgi:hypothetical protein